MLTKKIRISYSKKKFWNKYGLEINLFDGKIYVVNRQSKIEDSSHILRFQKVRSFLSSDY